MSTVNNLLEAIKNGDLQTTRKLLQGNTGNVNVRGYYGTPLHQACAFRRFAIVKFLLEEMKANVDAVDTGGMTPLHQLFTNREPNIEIVQILLTNGANVNAKSTRKDNWTALHWACCYKHIPLIQLLLNYGANTNLQDKYGDTPLYLACGESAKCIDVANLLLANNADRQLNSKLGWGPTRCAAHFVDCFMQKHLFESYDKSTLAISSHGNDKKIKRGTVVRLNPALSQHQHQLAIKAVMLVRQLPVHDVLVYEIMGFLSPAAVEKVFPPPRE